MSHEPVRKKRRFFQSAENAAEEVAESVKSEETPHTPSFGQTLRDFAGTVIENDILAILEQKSGGDVERALNLWLDGSWRKETKIEVHHETMEASQIVKEKGSLSLRKETQWKRRYLGSFGAQAYLTCSCHLQAGERVKITRQKVLSGTKSKPKAKTTTVMKPSKFPVRESPGKTNYITRFCLMDGTEIGRLPGDMAIMMSTLIDLDICSFEGSIIYAPERARSGSNIDLQIVSYISRSAFQNGSSPSANHEMLSDSNESAQERLLKLRRFSLLKLCEVTGLKSLDESLLDLQSGPDTQPDMTNKKAVPDSEDEDGTELQPDQLDTLYRKAQVYDSSMPQMEPSDTFALALRPYQKQALHWMLNKERQGEETVRKSDSMHPLWEMLKFPPPPDQSGLNHEEETFYLNPYSGELSLKFPKAVDQCHGGILADEMGLGKTIEGLIHTAKLARAAIEEGLPLNKEKTQKSHTTLVVAPLTLIQQWQSEADNASKEGTLKVLLYYGSDKALDLYQLCCGPHAQLAPDLIITSYGVILSEFVAMQGTSKVSPLFSVNFDRLVLDEAHTIKNRQSKTARACYSLQSSKRWVLTGTPIVNKLEDLFSLIHFLGVEPWSTYSFWKTFITIPFESKEYIKALDIVQTVLEPLVLRRTKDMKDVDGSAIVDLPGKDIQKIYLNFSEDERNIYNFIQARARKTFNQNALAGTVMKNYSYILSMILRLRQSCCDPTLVKQKVDNNDAEETIEEVDDSLGEDVDLAGLIATFSSSNASGECDAKTFGASVLQQIQEEADNECPICSAEPIENECVNSKCFHMACKSCMIQHIEFQRSRGMDPLCHSCRIPLNEKDLLQVVRQPATETGEEAKILLQPISRNQGSTKIVALMQHLSTARKTEPSIKSVVFSQFTSFLDLIQAALRRNNFKFVRLDGSMTLKDRAAVLEQFRNHVGNMTLIISLKAGGVGLNLTAASHVYMLDPWWSFAIEAQAIDRIHRMGQTKEVKVFRFIIKDSVEEKMLKIQDRKHFLGSALGLQSKEERKQQTLKDIQLLFED